MDIHLKTKKITLAVIAVLILAISLYTFVYKKPAQENIKNTKAGNTEVGNAGTDVSKKEFKIVTFGDSLTAGFGIDLKDSYPSMLENILNSAPEYENYNLTFRVINMGVSGETSSGGLDRIDFVLEQKPDLILLGLGANDMLRNADPALVLSNIDSIVQKIISSNTPLILLGMQSVASNGKEYKKDFDSIYPTLEKKYNLPIVPFFLEGVALDASLNTSDGIHPNRSGYEKIINKNILPVLNSVLGKIINM